MFISIQVVNDRAVLSSLIHTFWVIIIGHFFSYSCNTHSQNEFESLTNPSHFQFLSRKYLIYIPCIFLHIDLIRDIKDPERPCTLEELNVVSENSISVEHKIDERNDVTSPPVPLSSAVPSTQGLCHIIHLTELVGSPFRCWMTRVEWP